MMGWVSQATEKVTNSTSKILGTDGSGKGLLQGDLSGASDVVSGIGQQVADDPLLQTAISAAGMYFGIPPTTTAALLAANSTGQKGDVTAGLRAGALSLGTAAATNYFMTPTGTASAVTSTGAPITSSPVSSFTKTVSETLGLGEDSKVAKLLNSVGEKVTSVGGDAWNKAGNVVDKVSTWAEKNPTAAMTGLQAIGGAYTAGANREAADKAQQAAMDRLKYSTDTEKANNQAYMNSFNLADAAKVGPSYAGALRRKDGSLVFKPKQPV